MAEFFEFGGKSNIQNRDKLEHYRLEIKKLKEMNYMLEQRYEKKIKNLQEQIRNAPKHNHGNQYIPSNKLNNQIIKRDQEINRLKQENQRLKRQNRENPDRQLITKKREMFDLVADKDQEIMRLKKTIHELQNRYDGKYFNQSKIKQSYEMIIKENETLKKELMNKDITEEKKTEVNRDILEGIRYKKQYELLERENKLLRQQLDSLGQVRESKAHRSRVLGENTHNELLQSEVEKNHTMNNELQHEMSKLKEQNKKLREVNQSYRKSTNLESKLMQGQDESRFKKRTLIFDRQSASDSKKSSSSYSSRMDDEMDPQSNKISTVRKTGLYDNFGLDQVRSSYRQ